MTYQLRDYQLAAVRSIFQYFESNKEGNPIVAMPTGTGKSWVIGEFIHLAYTAYKTRIIVLTHVKELIEQDMDVLCRINPLLPVGVCSAGLGQYDTSDPILFAGIATAINRVDDIGPVDLAIIDEAHLVPPNKTSMYQRTLTALRQINPLLRVIGLTATAFRMGQGRLIEPGSIFTDICFDACSMAGFNWLLQQGYLAPLTPKNTETLIDTSNVKITAGEWNKKSLNEASDKLDLNKSIIRETIEKGHDRKKWLVFGSGIEHANHLMFELKRNKIPAGVITSEQDNKEREQVIERFRNGELRALCNNNILTTGFDFPNVDLIAVARATRSPVLHVQMLGRGTRPAPDKKDCLVLDFARNTELLGPINDPVLPPRKGQKKNGQAPVKECSHCRTLNHIAATECVHCGQPFHIQTRLKDFADPNAELIRSSIPQIEVFKVHSTIYSIHKKEDKPPSLRVMYYSGYRSFNEWVCFEHIGFPRKKAVLWWKQWAATEPPLTTGEAFSRRIELKMPTFIKVRVNTKYPEVVGYGKD